MIDFTDYKNIILDFDGVILDSNFIKEKAISEISNKFLDDIKSKEFINYFISNNGLPREIKIKKYFNDEKRYSEVLKCYNNILDIELQDAKFTASFDLFLKKLYFYNLSPYVLSGGDEKEIISLLEDRNLLNSFTKIMGGPLTKYENIDNLKLNGKTLYIGDSQIDYEVAIKYNFDFIYMYEYTQFKDWKEYFKDKKEIKIIKNFEALTYSHC